MLKHSEDCLKSRAVWIFIQLLENPSTKKLVHSHLKGQAKTIDAFLKSKELKGNKGLQVLKEKISSK